MHETLDDFEHQLRDLEARMARDALPRALATLVRESTATLHCVVGDAGFWVADGPPSSEGAQAAERACRLAVELLLRMSKSEVTVNDPVLCGRIKSAERSLRAAALFVREMKATLTLHEHYARYCAARKTTNAGPLSRERSQLEAYYQQAVATLVAAVDTFARVVRLAYGDGDCGSEGLPS